MKRHVIYVIGYEPEADLTSSERKAAISGSDWCVSSDRTLDVGEMIPIEFLAPTKSGENLPILEGATRLRVVETRLHGKQLIAEEVSSP